MAPFADLTDDMDELLMSSLNDGCGDYFDASGRCVARGVEVIIDHNLQRVGPDGGVFMSDAIAITFRKVCISKPERGGVIAHGGKRYVIEEEVANDGHMITVACMVQK